MNIKRSQRIVAAEGDEFDTDDLMYDEDESLSDTLDDVADTVEDMQDSMDDIREDDVDIEVDNNIAGHYIAECDNCHGVFISAVIESDQHIDHVSGVCPLCEKESDQYLKWVISAVEDRDSGAM